MYFQIFTAEEFHTYESLFISSAFFIVTSCTTVGYGNITPVSTKGQLFVIFVLVFSIVFFGYFLSKMREAFQTLRSSYSDLLLIQLTEVQEWLFCREKNAMVGRETNNFVEKKGKLEYRKFLQTFRSYVLHNLQGSIFGSYFYLRLPSKIQDAILEEGLQTFYHNFSFLYKSISIDSFKEIFATVTPMM